MFSNLKSKISNAKSKISDSKIGDIYRSVTDIPKTSKDVLNDRGQYMTNIEEEIIYKAKDTVKSAAHKAKNVAAPVAATTATLYGDAINYFATVDNVTGAGNFWHTHLGEALDNISNDTGILDEASAYEAPVLRTTAGVLLLISIYNIKKNKNNLDSALELGDLLNNPDYKTESYGDKVVEKIKDGKIPKGILKELVNKPYLLSASDNVEYKTGYSEEQTKSQEEIKEASDKILEAAEKYLDDNIDLINRITPWNRKDKNKYKEDNPQADELERQLYFLEDYTDKIIVDDTSDAILDKISNGTLTYKLLNEVEKSMKKKNRDTRRINLLRIHLTETITDNDELKHYLITDEPYKKTETSDEHTGQDITDELGELKTTTYTEKTRDYPPIRENLMDSIKAYATRTPKKVSAGTPEEEIRDAANVARKLTQHSRTILKEKRLQGTDKEPAKEGFPINPKHKIDPKTDMSQNEIKQYVDDMIKEGKFYF
ncbi:MAG: hypothetical protein DRN71_00235 [Candidatus Nanohalarchaeota archaeon]|nr:MAG: hypothetical protein DRN71_00235 [Candidatus Nanohaloarchaeota archaeon]